MFCGRKALKSIENIQERALRLSYNDYVSTYDELLKKSGFDKVHHSHIKKVALEMFKVMNNISPTIISPPTLVGKGLVISPVRSSVRLSVRTNAG